MYEKEVEELQKIIDDSSRIVFFGGAGVSTESGIPDFRSADGIYHQQYKYSPECGRSVCTPGICVRRAPSSSFRQTRH